ncbi:MAG TPA: GTP cyclohydrolase I, partial [Pyrinomonadaceae bacterium]
MSTKTSDAAEEELSQASGIDLELVARGVRMILEGIGEDPERAGLQSTPQRVAEMYAELTA